MKTKAALELIDDVLVWLENGGISKRKIVVVADSWYSNKTLVGHLKEKGIDTLVLGCTHYPLLKDTIDNFMGEKVELIDSAEETS